MVLDAWPITPFVPSLPPALISSAPPLNGWIPPLAEAVRAYFADPGFCAQVRDAVMAAARKTSGTADPDGESTVAMLSEADQSNIINSVFHANIIRQFQRSGRAGYGRELIRLPADTSAAPDNALPRRPGCVLLELPVEIKTATDARSGFSANDVQDKTKTGRMSLLIGTNFVKDVRSDKAIPSPDPRRRISPWMIRLGWVGAADYSGWSISKLDGAPYHFMVPIWLPAAAELPAILVRGLGLKTLTKLGLTPTDPISALPAPLRSKHGLPSLDTVTYGDIIGDMKNVFLPEALAAARTYDRALIPLF